MRRHEPIPALTVELVPLFRCGRGKQMKTARGAYMRAAWYAIHQAREAAGTNRNGYQGDGCGCIWVGDGSIFHSCRWHDEECLPVVAARLARWLRWRDSRLAAMAAAPEKEVER